MRLPMKADLWAIGLGVWDVGMLCRNERLTMECRDSVVEHVVGVGIVAGFLALLAIVEGTLPR
jgi:hypothetical protein